jgi:nitrogen fixation NifU-like protein
MDDLYRSELMEVYKDPSHKGQMLNPSIVLDQQNTFCGDHVHLALKIKNNIIEDAQFDGEMCFVSIIGADFLLEEIIGKTVTEARKIDQAKLLKLIDLNLSTSRIACATLTLKALQKALTEYETKKD